MWKELAMGWITEVDQLKAQQHYVQHLLGKKVICRNASARSGFSLPEGISCTSTNAFPRGLQRASLSNQGLSGRTIFYANKCFCEQL